MTEVTDVLILRTGAHGISTEEHATALSDRLPDDMPDPEPLPPNHELRNLNNAFITPHSAGHTPYSHERLADIVAENRKRAAETGSSDDLGNQVA